MGPTNVALVKYFQVDQELREAKARLDAASKDVRVQERRLNDLLEKHKQAQQTQRENQSAAANLELDLKSRDEHIEKLRTQQQNARNNKEYQTFLVEINTSKVDRNKVEDETMKLLEQVERGNKEVTDLAAAADVERTKLAELREQIGDKLHVIEAEIAAIAPRVEAAGKAVPATARETFNRMSDRFDGEAMSAISKPNRRQEEYVCSACNMELVIDVYNKLHSRDEMIFCPSCRRMLYIPDDLPPEVAIKNMASSTSKKSSEGSEGAAPKKRASRKSSSSASVENPVQRALLKAAGESAQNAIAGGNDPQEFEVLLDGKSIGAFKGQSAENLQRTAQFCLKEAGITGEVTVLTRSAPAESASVEADPIEQQPAN